MVLVVISCHCVRFPVQVAVKERLHVDVFLGALGEGEERVSSEGGGTIDHTLS